jgi:hypothetical protein
VFHRASTVVSHVARSLGVPSGCLVTSD